MSEVNTIEQLLNNVTIQKIYKNKTELNPVWGGKATNKFKDFVKKNKDALNQMLKKAGVTTETTKKTETKSKTTDKQEIKSTVKKPIIKAKSTSRTIRAAMDTTKTDSATIFNATYADTWRKLTEIQKGKKGPWVKGIILLIPGDVGTGKTRFGVDFSNYKGHNLEYRIIPPGLPLFIIATDPSPYHELMSTYPELMWKTNKDGNPEGIFYVNCNVTDPSTGYVDPVLTLAEINKYMSSLKDLSCTIVIEDWSIYCAFVLYAYMLSEGKSFSSFLKPEKELVPTEYQYKERVIDRVLLSFQNDYIANVILIANSKDKYVNKGKSIYDSVVVGQIPDVSKGTDRKVDVVATMYKSEMGNNIIRKMMITKSRFEGEIVNKDNIVIIRPSPQKLMSVLIEKYLKKGVTKSE